MSFEAKVAECGARIARLLAADVRAFAASTTRARFVANPERAAAMDDDALQALKQRTEALGDTLASHLEATLVSPTLWLSLEPPEGGSSTPLTVIPEVAQAGAQVAQALETHLIEAGLGEGGSVEWRLPMRFIDGENLGTLTHALWKAVARLDQARRETDRAQAQAATEARLRRWDDA